MNILIVEDDSFKFSKISNLLTKLDRSYTVVHQDNVFGAINYIRERTPDKILLDMSLPSHPAVAGEGSPLSMPNGGIEVILEIKILRKESIPILILTQYPDIEVEYEYYSIQESQSVIRDLYGIRDITVVHYDNDNQDWEESTMNFLEK